MKCKYCGAEMTHDATRCPACGEEIASGKLSAGKIALLAVLVVIAVAVIAALVFVGVNADQPTEPTPPASQPVPSIAAPTIPEDGNPDNVTCKGSYTVADAELPGVMGNVVATVGENTLTNEELQIYYWMQFYDFLEMYSSYISMLGLDIYGPLDTQISLDGTTTWQQFFLQNALETWANYAALSEAARAAGYELPQEYRDELDGMAANLDSSAKSMGFENGLAMIQADMGPGATVEAYLSFMEDYYLGNLYYAHCMEQLEFTDEEVDAYFTEHEAEYAEKGLDRTTRFVNARHILILPVSATGASTYTEEEWETCRLAAQAILDEYLAGELTEERFAQLANTYSEDPGSKTNGGLYENIYVGQMVKPFEEWCFDTTRAAGDTGLVRTSYGYHVMYYVGYSEAWYETAWNDLVGEQGEAVLAEIVETYPVTVDYSTVALGLVAFNAQG